MKRLIPKRELPKLAEWCRNNDGGINDYLKQKTLIKYVEGGE